MSFLSQTKSSARDNGGITAVVSHAMKSASHWLKVSNRSNLAKNSNENLANMKTQYPSSIAIYWTPIK